MIRRPPRCSNFTVGRGLSYAGPRREQPENQEHAEENAHRATLRCGRGTGAALLRPPLNRSRTERGTPAMVEQALVPAAGLDEAMLLSVLSDVKSGDFSVRMPLGWTGLAGKIADTFNDVIAANETLGIELARASRVVGKEGKLSQRVAVRGSDRVWSESIESVNKIGRAHV